MKNKIPFAVAALAGTVSSADVSDLHHDVSRDPQTLEGGEKAILADFGGNVAASQQSGEVNFRSERSCFSHEVLASEPIEWNRSTERKFKQLAVKEALETITEEERGYLSMLEHVRESQVYPSDPLEVMLSYRRNVATRNLISALQEYVKYSLPKAKNRSKGKAEGENY